MKHLIVVPFIFVAMLISGCTIVQYTYMRNLSEDTAEIYFDFDAAAMKSIPDSLHIPFSSMSHPVNSKTYSFMTDSIVAKRYSGTTLLIHLPSGGMIMFDKNTAKKIGYYGPEKIKVAVPGKEAYTVKLVGPVEAGEKQFLTKGNSPKIYWHDIY
jgi:hypothetical protein